ncbi:hemerythrin domain-containing protein [Ramlibacter sp. AW1]|uniref:Hemerythrin domain-containing protein n=1 Tax=Ramlibacter aurantiacus TaxID=2801330 RepID=A0A936ZIZ9_9BURK|nr:hemerythrin domain-containing protein [Ramlibacter aurantiacus]MBL0422274.1 hemerythrin domain-containing protein [Ramlibacter aurantiacus]
MNIFDALRVSHDQQRKLSRRLIAADEGRGDLHQAFLDLKAELAAHETAEERFFYIPLWEHDETVDPSRHAIAEHHEMDEMVEELEGLDEGSDAWSDLAHKLVHKIEHHLAEEEDKFFQAAGRVLSAEQKIGLALQYREEFDRLIQKESEAS